MKKRAVLTVAVAGVVLLSSACASAPPAAPAAPTVGDGQKLGWILRLEDRRILASEGSSVAMPPAAPARPGARSLAPAFVAAPDLRVLAHDPSARIRRRVALAIGRVGLEDGLPVLARLLQDAEPEVRAMAAFATGLIGSRDGIASLTAALTDASPLVQGRAAEGLGLIGEPSSAGAVASMAIAYVPQAAAMSGDQETAASAEADAWRLAAFALVRMRNWDALARITVGEAGAVTTWWPAAFALQRINNPAALPALRQLAAGAGAVGPAFAMRGLSDHRDNAARPLLTKSALDA
ncbi:MAG: HEAT repeat domain-containing protein, partial [Acidobacteriota bacterium]|nr:HEAT repeat domain-containing protein [Acidobacteriota bacterium]